MPGRQLLVIEVWDWYSGMLFPAQGRYLFWIGTLRLLFSLYFYLLLSTIVNC